MTSSKMLGCLIDLDIYNGLVQWTSFIMVCFQCWQAIISFLSTLTKL